MDPILIVLGLVVILVLWGIGTYNKFVTLKAQIEAAVQEIGNQLKRQINLLPNIEALLDKFLNKQDKIFEQITQARKRAIDITAKKDASAQEMIDASAQVQRALSAINALAESTPEIKGESATVKAMDEVRDTMDKIMYATRTLIDLTLSYNTMVVTIPSMLIANLFGFRKQQALQMPETIDQLTVKQSDTQIHQMSR